MSEIILLSRKVDAYLIPSGAHIELPHETEVRITQALGDSFTVSIYGNLARIDGKDADALGKAMVSPLTQVAEDAPLSDKIWAVLKTCYDPEIPVNIVDLGLIYSCDIIPTADNLQNVTITMTLTAPGCGMGPFLANDVKEKITALTSVGQVEVNIVFDPPWDRSRMSDAAKLELGIF